jgi:phosphate transport system permease protein
MLTGVVGFEPDLPINTEAPFLHLQERFMHLGFHIYAVGFQSPNVEAAEPLVYATASLLLVLVISLNLVAIRWRTKVRRSLQGR